MAGIQQVSFTTPGYDYAADEAEIKRRQMMSDLLQKQSMEPIDPTRQAGGWTIPISPWEGAAKIAQGAASGINAARSQKLQRELAGKIQQNMANALREGSGMLQDRPAQTLQPSAMGEGGQAAETGIANIPARPADPMGALSAFAKDPQALALGGPMAMAAMQRQQMVAALMGGQGGQPQLQGAPQQPGMPPQAGAQPGAPGQAPQGPQAGPQSAIGGPAGGVPMAAWIQADPSGAKYMEQLAKDQAASRTLTRVAPGGFAVNQGGQAVFSAPTTEGSITNFGPGGPTQSVVPGALGTQAALGKTPLEKVQNADQTFSYIPRGQLAGAAMASPIPQAPQPPVPVPGAPQPRSPSPANFPRETPAQNAQGWEGRARILNSELAQEQQRAAAATTPEDRQQAQENIAAIQKELGGVPRGPAGGPPKFGQTQEQQIEQAAQTAEQSKFGQEKAQLAITAPQARSAVADATNGLLRMEKIARQIRDDPALDRITGVMGAIPNIPGSKAADITANLNSLKSQVGFAVLQAMRDASKTGGALGQISDRENELLQRNLAAIDHSQSAEGMKKSLQTIIDYAVGARERINRGYKDTYERVLGSQGMQPTSRGAVKAGGAPAALDTSPQAIADEMRRRGLIK